MRILTFLLLVASCYGVLADGIENVRVRTEPERARVVFDLKDAISYRAFTMSNPDRVVIDIENISYPKALSLPSSEDEAQPSFEVLERLRYAVRNDTGLRIVLDLNNSVALKHTILPPRQDYGHRLVLDLYRPNRAASPTRSTNAVSKPDKAKSQPAVREIDKDALRVVEKKALLPSTNPPDDGAKALAILNGEPPATGDDESAAAPTSLAGTENAKQQTNSKPSAQAAIPPVGKRFAKLDAKIPPVPVGYKPPRDVVIAIDAGHGGHDVGAVGPKGTYEKDIVLQIAQQLAKEINKQHGMRAILTRTGDEYVGLRDRMHRARQRQADLFVSIHADAFRDRRVRGSSVYVLSQNGASSEAARWLAENENSADLVGGVRLGDKDDVVKSVLLDLSQTASIDASIDAADSVLAALKSIGKVHKRSVQKAGFMVLKSPDIPSLLVETAFISNPTEEQRLRSRVYQRKLASALANGIVDYFSDNPLPETRFAEKYRRQHKVSQGDTLSEIAERYAVSMESIKLANEMSRDRVLTGEVLTIP